MARAPRGAAGKRSFHQELVLNRWMLGFFKGGSLGALKLRLGDDRHEGIDDDGQTLFFHELAGNLFEPQRIGEAELRRYDLNIVAHWQRITAQRNKREGHELQMKYFQYLSLLFSEIYLDWYFNRREALLDGLEGLEMVRSQPAPHDRRQHDRRRHRDAPDPDDDSEDMQSPGNDHVGHRPASTRAISRAFDCDLMQRILLWPEAILSPPTGGLFALEQIIPILLFRPLSCRHDFRRFLRA